MDVGALAGRSIRHALARNLELFPEFDVRTWGLQLEIESANHGAKLFSEVSRGSREAAWLVSGSIFAALPLNIRVLAVMVEDARNSRKYLENLACEFANSTAARSFHPHDHMPPRHEEHLEEDVNGARDPKTIVVYTDRVDRLLPLAQTTARDLVRARLPANSLVFATEHVGTLYASHSTAIRVYHFWSKEFPVALVVSPDDAQETLLASAKNRLKEEELREVEALALRIVKARRRAKKAKDQIQVRIARSSQAEAARQHSQVITTIRQLEAQQESALVRSKEAQASRERTEGILRERVRGLDAIVLSRQVHSTKVELDSLRRVIDEERLLWRKAGQRLLSRRLVLAAGIMRVFPLDEREKGTLIRDVNMASQNEEERAVAFGMLAHLVSVLSNIFDIPLRYSLFPYGSRSFVMDDAYFASSLDGLGQQQRMEDLSNASAMAATPGLFPLFTVGVERGAKSKAIMGVERLLHDVQQITEVLRVCLPGRPSIQPQASTGRLNFVDTLVSLKRVLMELRLIAPLRA